MPYPKAPINLHDHTSLIYAEGVFGKDSREKFPMRAKTADGILRYATYPIHGIVDSKAKENLAQDVLGVYLTNSMHARVPLFSSLKEAREKTGADVLILGAAPEGGELPPEWEQDLLWALEQGMHVVSGMHYSLKENSKFYAAAKTSGAVIWDTRTDISIAEIPVGSAKAYHIKKPVILTVGTDAALGKMTAAYELHKEAQRRGIHSLLVPTGQTCMMIEGWGIAVDALPADFMAGAVEKMLVENTKYGEASAPSEVEGFFVEGQGSLYHPGFSNTTISLIHGAVPTHMVLVHRPSRKHSIGSKLVKLPEIPEAIELYERVILPPYQNAKIVGVALNTAGMTDEEIQTEIEKISKQTNLPVGDVVRHPQFVSQVVDAIFGTAP